MGAIEDEETTEAELPESVKVFKQNYVQLEGKTVADVLARVLKWQHQNSLAQPISVSYTQVGTWHSAGIVYIEPFDEES